MKIMIESEDSRFGGGTAMDGNWRAVHPSMTEEDDH